QFCRCHQAHRAGVDSDLSAGKGSCVSRHRYPCRRRPVRSDKRRSRAKRRMAHRHCPGDAGAIFAGRDRIGHAVSRSRQGLQSAARPQDRLTACELDPNARKKLIEALRRDEQARVVDLDGWMALSAFVPPNARRGLVLIDPPFEAKDEFERMAAGFATAFAKWPTGSYLLWYPAKSRRATDVLAEQVAATTASAASPGKCLRLEFSVAPQTEDPALTSAGLLIVNPPWTLANELKIILPELEKPLGQGGAGRFRLEVPKS